MSRQFHLYDPFKYVYGLICEFRRQQNLGQIYMSSQNDIPNPYSIQQLKFIGSESTRSLRCALTIWIFTCNLIQMLCVCDIFVVVVIYIICMTRSLRKHTHTHTLGTHLISCVFVWDITTGIPNGFGCPLVCKLLSEWIYYIYTYNSPISVARGCTTKGQLLMESMRKIYDG